MSKSATEQHSNHLPTPPSPGELGLSKSHKRKRTHLSGSDISERPPKQQYQKLPSERSNPVRYWVKHEKWPPPLLQMPSKRSSSTSGGTHWSDTQRKLDRQRIYADDGLSEKHKDDDDLLNNLSTTTLTAKARLSCPAARFKDLSRHVQERNESSIQTYILPYVLPSPIMLRMNGIEGMDGLDEEYNAEWIRCQPFLASRPKPDYVVGFSSRAFSKDLYSQLERYATISNSAFVTPNLCFPFLICEVKSGQIGLVNAERQSLHSAAIAMRSMFSLYEAAYGKDSAEIQKDLNGRILVFSIIHDHDDLKLHGHYARGTDATTREYYRCRIVATSLTSNCQHDVYRFVLKKIYETYAPQHLKRVKNALTRLPSPGPLSPDSETTEVDSQSPSEGVTSKRARTMDSETGEAEQAQSRKQLSDLLQKIDEQQKQLEELQRQLKEQTEEKNRLRKDFESSNSKQNSQDCCGCAQSCR